MYPIESCIPIRMVKVVILDMQNPNVTALKTKKWPRPRFLRNRVIWHTASIKKIAMKTADTATSVLSGRPPKLAFRDGYGGPVGCGAVSIKCY
jgi:hypothetical protein